MQENYYKKFIHFLKEHNLYDENAMEYLHEKGIFFNYLEEENRDFIKKIQHEINIQSLNKVFQPANT